VAKVLVQLESEGSDNAAPYLVMGPPTNEGKTAAENGEFLDDESTMDLEAVLDKEHEEKVTLHDQRFKEGLKKVENINLETNTYGALHRDIEDLQKQKKAAEVKKQTGPPQASAKKTSAKLGPNAQCPCGRYAMANVGWIM